MVMPKDAWGSMWGGRGRVAHGWMENEGPASLLSENQRGLDSKRKEATGPSLSARILHFWGWLSLVPWLVDHVCAWMWIPMGPSAAEWGPHSGLGPK